MKLVQEKSLFNDKRFIIFSIAAGFLIALAVSLFSLWQVLVAIFAIAFFVFTFLKPRWVILFIMAWMPFEPFILKFVPDQIFLFAKYFSESLIYFLAITLFIRILIGEKKIKQTPIDLPVILFLIVIAASALINFVPGQIAILGIRQIIRFILLFFIVVYIFPTQEFIRKATIVMFFIVMFQACLGLVQYVSLGALDNFLLPSEQRFYEGIQINVGVEQFWESGARIFSTLGRYDLLGTFLAFFALLAVGFLYTYEYKGDKNKLLLILILGLPAILLTYSRSSWFGFLLGFIMIGLVLMRDKRIWIGLAVFLGLVFGYLFYSDVVVPQIIEVRGIRQTVAERFLETFSIERWKGEYYGLGRLYFMIQTPLLVLHSPVFGFGPGQYGGGAAAALYNRTIYDRYSIPFGIYGTEGMIDNNWFSILGETGFIGLSLYVWIFVALFLISVKVFRNSKNSITKGLALGFSGTIIAVTLNAFLGTFFEVRTLAIYFWIFAGFVMVLGRREKIV